MRDVRIQDTFGNIPVEFGDGANLDAFQRIRVGNPAPVFENKNIHSRKKSQWEEPIVGAILAHGAVTGGPFQVGEEVVGGASGSRLTVTTVGAGFLVGDLNHNDYVDGETLTGQISGATATLTTHNTGSDVFHVRDTASVTLKIGDSAGDIAVRQTHRYLNYVPGKSHEIWMTFNFDSVGDVYLVHRTGTSGSPVDNLIHQNDPSKSTDGESVWNLDALDGTGHSRINLDFTKETFIVIDMQWQGTGRVRMGFFHNGRIIYAHEFNFSNSLEDAYMSTPSLPVKHEIENIDGTIVERRSGYFNGSNGLFLKQASTDGTRTMKEVCTAVVSVAGLNPVGLGFSASNEVTPRTINNIAKSPMLAVRLKNTHPEGGENRITVELENATFFPVGNSSHFEVWHMHDPTGITATWTDKGAGSGVEYSTDISAVTGNPGHKIIDAYSGAGQAGKGSNEDFRTTDKLDQHRFVTQNFDSTNSEMFVIFGEAITGNATGYSSMAWVESE
jgi:hypothetical protein